MKTKVRQFEGRNGAVKNQFIITNDKGSYFNLIIQLLPLFLTVQEKQRLTKLIGITQQLLEGIEINF